MPTGWRSVYLGQQSVKMLRGGKLPGTRIPAGNLKGSTEDLGTYKLRHLGEVDG